MSNFNKLNELNNSIRLLNIGDCFDPGREINTLKIQLKELIELLLECDKNGSSEKPDNHNINGEAYHG